MTEDLGAERNRLTNRMRELLWRYYPALLTLENDLGADWLPDLWETVPTPAKAARVRETTIARLLRLTLIVALQVREVFSPPSDDSAEYRP